MKKSQKGSANIFLIIVIILLLGVVGYLVSTKKNLQITPIPETQNTNSVSQSFTPPAERVIGLSADYYFGVSEPTIGVKISGKFYSHELLVQYLSLDKPVGNYKGKTITLNKILVSTDMIGGGDTATWIVAGPQSLLEEYVKTLKDSADDGIIDGSKNVFYDFFSEIVPVAAAFD